jgi:hypothetical protein
MSTFAERPRNEQIDDPKWLFVALKAGFFALAASDWLQERFRRMPSMGLERIGQPIGHDEAVSPRALALHIQRARYLHNGVVASDGGSDMWSLRGRSAGVGLLRDSQNIAQGTDRRQTITFTDALRTAADQRYAEARAEAHDADRWEHTVNVGYGYALDSFSSVNLEFLAQADLSQPDPSKSH